MLPAPTPANTETGPLLGPGFFWRPRIAAHGQVVSAWPAARRGPRYLDTARHHVVVMPHPYTSAINAPHVKVMGIIGEISVRPVRRARNCHTLNLRGSLKSRRKSGVYQLVVQISHTTQLFGLDYWEKRNSLRTIS